MQAKNVQRVQIGNGEHVARLCITRTAYGVSVDVERTGGSPPPGVQIVMLRDGRLTLAVDDGKQVITVAG